MNLCEEGRRVFNRSKNAEVIRLAASGWKSDNPGGRVSNPSERADVAGVIRHGCIGLETR